MAAGQSRQRQGEGLCSHGQSWQCLPLCLGPRRPGFRRLSLCPPQPRYGSKAEQRWKAGHLPVPSWLSLYGLLPKCVSQQFPSAASGSPTTGKEGVTKRMWTVESDRPESKTPAMPSPKLRGAPELPCLPQCVQPHLPACGGAHENYRGSLWVTPAHVGREISDEEC